MKIGSTDRAWRQGYRTGKREGARISAQFGPVSAQERSECGALQKELLGLLVRGEDGPPSADAIARVRALATSFKPDPDSSRTLAVGVLAEQFGDAASRAWLAPMLAHRGRLDEALKIDVPWDAEGRPGPNWYTVLVNAAALLGRMEDARALAARIGEVFPRWHEDVVTVWDDSPQGRAYRALAERDRDPATVPNFYHLPFCGGTSMAIAMSTSVPRDLTIEITRRGGLHQVERTLDMTGAEAARLLLVNQHHPYVLDVPGREMRYFTVLRDPVSQIASGYHKRSESSRVLGTLDESTTFERHVEYTLRRGLTNTLARQIAILHPDIAKGQPKAFGHRAHYRNVASEEDMYWVGATARLSPKNLLELAREVLATRFDVVGSMAHLQASHLACAAQLGLPAMRAIVHAGKSRRSRTEPIPLADDLRAANAVDQQLFEEHTEAFGSEYADLVDAVV
ncbi:hypothetical protein [Brevibacterium litoralis]|uniref:hypothetical protein n=1 Tax=Brevibacterium litoralis TaxID=3138935 RepID=UPI0032EAE228